MVWLAFNLSTRQRWVVSLAVWPLDALAPTEKRLHGAHTWPGHLAPAGNQGPNHPACNPIAKLTMLCRLPLFTHSMQQDSSSEIHRPYLVKEFSHFIETKCCFSTNKYKLWDVMSIKNMGWDAVPCEWVRLYQYFAGTCFLHLQGRNAPLKMERTVCLKCWYSSMQVHCTENTLSWKWCMSCGDKSYINTCQCHVSQHDALLL